MEPNLLGRYNTFRVDPGPVIPLPQDDEDVMTEKNLPTECSAVQPGTCDNNTDWTAWGIDISRGQFGPAHPAHQRSDRVGWKPCSKVFGIWPLESSHASQSTSTASSDSIQNIQFPHPLLSLPAPSLDLDFRMSVTLNPKISVGTTPYGHRNWITFTGGTWSGSFGSGIVLPGGQDCQIVTSDGSGRLDTQYLLQTADEQPAHIVIKTQGWRTGPPEILEALADPMRADDVDPRLYKFRLFIQMETGDERYRDKVNYGMWVGSGMRKGYEVIYDAYRVT